MSCFAEKAILSLMHLKDKMKQLRNFPLSACKNESSSLFHNNLSSQHGTTSYFDHIACTNPQLVSQMKILYGDALHDHIPIYCEVAIPCINSVANLQEQHSEKYHFKWNNISDD